MEVWITLAVFGQLSGFFWAAVWRARKKKIEALEKMRPLCEKAAELEEYLRQEWHENALLNVRIHLEIIRREFPDLGQRHERYDFRAIHQELLQTRSLRWEVERLEREKREEIDRLQQFIKRSRKAQEFKALQEGLAKTEVDLLCARNQLQKIREALG